MHECVYYVCVYVCLYVVQGAIRYAGEREKESLLISFWQVSYNAVPVIFD